MGKATIFTTAFGSAVLKVEPLGDSSYSQSVVIREVERMIAEGDAARDFLEVLNSQSRLTRLRAALVLFWRGAEIHRS